MAQSNPREILEALLGKDALSKNPNAEIFKEALAEITEGQKEAKKKIVKTKVEEALKLLAERDKLEKETKGKIAKIDKTLGKLIKAIDSMSKGECHCQGKCEEGAAPAEEGQAEAENPGAEG